MPEHFENRKRIRWRVEGPFDSSYSLALVNREIALALEGIGHDVSLHSTEGPGDFLPSETFLQQYPEVNALYQKSLCQREEDTDVTSRNIYPPRVDDMHSPLNMLHNYAWEESGFPTEWIERFNTHLQGIAVTSRHVKKLLIDNGATVPLSVCGNGVDHWEKIVPDSDYRVEGGHSFRFLHVSSCFPRKGADVLLKSYGKAFSGSDDVLLVIKTFKNPHNEIHRWIAEAEKEFAAYPDVIVIEEELEPEQMKALYGQCDVLVSPSRAEGFGLPLAEAMLSGLAVIATGWSGQLDFCTEETAWLIDYAFAAAETHFELFNSVWAEPSAEHLAALMKDVYELPEEERLQKSRHGRKLLLQNFKWSDAAHRLAKAAEDLSRGAEKKELRIGWVTTWNTRCGIAAYSEHLIDAMHQEVSILAAHADKRTAPDGANVHRCWSADGNDTLQRLVETVDVLELTTIVIQFNYGFFNFHHLYEFLYQQFERGNRVVFMMHSTTDPEHILFKDLQILLPALERVDRITVHSVSDLNHLKAHGLVGNVALFPHGIPDWQGEEKEKRGDAPFLLGSYGFFLPHKGLLELIDTVKILVDRGADIRLKMMNAEYPVPVSAKLIETARKKIADLGLLRHVELQTGFLPMKSSLAEMASCDLLLFPYQETGESSSAAVRSGLAAGKPVAVTPLGIFEDVNPAVYKLSGCTQQEMAESIYILIEEIKYNTETVRKQKDAAKKWRESHRFSTLGKRLENILEALNHAGKT